VIQISLRLLWITITTTNNGSSSAWLLATTNVLYKLSYSRQRETNAKANTNRYYGDYKLYYFQ